MKGFFFQFQGIVNHGRNYSGDLEELVILCPQLESVVRAKYLCLSCHFLLESLCAIYGGGSLCLN